MSAQKFFESLQNEVPAELLDSMALAVRDVEAVLAERVCSEVELAASVAKHTLQAGGKRLRPALTLLAAQAVGSHFEYSRAIRLGAALEMVHMATLIHDDVIDESATRRGKTTAAQVFGATPSILAGDMLLAKAMQILAEDGDLAIIRIVSDAVVELAEGETLELQHRGDFDLSCDEHLRVLRMKTAGFIECCCLVGATIASAPPQKLEALRSYGHFVGMAFQIVDDLLDFRGDKAVMGKERATDYREGCATYPLIAARAEFTDDERLFVASHFGDSVLAEDIERVSQIITTRGGYAAATTKAESLAAQAVDALQPLPDGPSRSLLASVVRFVVERDA